MVSGYSNWRTALGFGLSYTTFHYANMELAPDTKAALTVRLSISNTGNRKGTETAVIYATLPASAGEPPNRLVGWSRVHLEPGQTSTVRISIKAKQLSVFDDRTNRWKLVPGRYVLHAGGGVPRPSALGNNRLALIWTWPHCDAVWPCPFPDKRNS